MFIPYSADIPYNRRQWISYVLFPIILFLTGIQLIQSERSNYFYPSSLNYPGIIALFFVICNLILLWLFGNSVCSRIGNWSYVAMVIIISVVSQVLNELVGGITVLSLSCIVNLLTGIYIVFWPLNQIDCFLLVPPWRTFSVAGLWITLPWLLLNALAAGVNETFLFYLIELSTVVLGAIIAVSLLKLKIVDMDEDDETLLQVFSRTEPDDLAWSESWSVRKNVKDGDDDEVGNLIKKPITTKKNEEECISVLCKCGNIVEIPVRTENNAVSCPECSRKVIRPDSGHNPRSSA